MATGREQSPQQDANGRPEHAGELDDVSSNAPPLNEGSGAPRSDAVPPAAPPAWRAPSQLEHDLYEAKMAGAWDAYLDVLSRTELFHIADRAALDAGKYYFTEHWFPNVRNYCVPVHTHGTLPPPVENPVYYARSLRWFASAWEPEDPPYLAVNPGTPCEAYLPTSTTDRQTWRLHTDRAETTRPRHRLCTLSVGGPLHGPVAHGLACGALLCVANGSLWNAMAWHGTGYDEERERLKDWWGITDREGWRDAVDGLLDPDGGNPVWNFVLELRRGLAKDFGGSVDTEYWRIAAERMLRRRAEAAAAPRLTPDGVSAPTPLTATELEAQISGVRSLIGRITRYEARFRADGILPENGWVRSVESWSYSRASKMARWGLGARYCTMSEAESVVLRAGELSRLAYRSWEQLSAGYILGRCLHFDEEEFGEWYHYMRKAHDILMTKPGSPWLNIPFGLGSS